MKNNTEIVIEESFRQYYGQIFSSLVCKFGIQWVTEIEDAIQNAFYKSLKSWKPERLPADKGSWLYVVAKNDLLNQIKKAGSQLQIPEEATPTTFTDDPRLRMILIIAGCKAVSLQGKIFFTLKNIFGLSVREMSVFALQSEEAIYKNIARSKKSIAVELKNFDYERDPDDNGDTNKEIVEEILYAVFNMAYDSFNPKIMNTIDEDLCMDALALAKIFHYKFRLSSTSNLLALFCFHLARIPAKIKDGVLVTFFNQDKALWDQQLLQSGLTFLSKPEKTDKYYIEALIVSKHMLANVYDDSHWCQIIDLYTILLQWDTSPFIRLNLAYCYFMAGEKERAYSILDSLANLLPEDHFYYTLVKLHIQNDLNTFETKEQWKDLMNQTEQEIRRNLINSFYIV